MKRSHDARRSKNSFWIATTFGSELFLLLIAVSFVIAIASSW